MRTTCIRFDADEATCRRVDALFLQTLDPEHAAVSLFETAPHRWAVEAHVDDDVDAAALRASVAAVVGENDARTLAFDRVAEKDWVAASLADLKPVAAGRFVVHGAHDRARVPPNRIGIEIEAALAFGTGHHGTTRGCLLALEDWLKVRQHGPARVLDLGTGTGVLAIAAAKALRTPVLASDIDPLAVRVARGNARANGAGAFVEVVHATGATGRQFRARGRYDLVFANILLRPLQRLAAPLQTLLAPGGTLILSGLLPSHANAALAAYRLQGLHLRHRLVLEGWVTLVLSR
ncbi:MAG TPA: 50S ribosomal protein L11 methyltransferase [Xanthobacteraceae bacterium]